MSAESIPRLKFADKHIDRIIEREKTATIRVNLDDPKMVIIEKPIGLADSDGNLFGTVIVSQIAFTTVEQAAARDIDGHRSYDDTADLLDELREYYPETEIDAETDVTIVYWKQLDETR